VDNLTSLLDKATSLTLELLDVLSEERAALSQPDIAILETVIEKKLGIAQALQAIDQQRDNALAKLGAAPGATGIEDIVATNTDQQLNNSWQTLCEASLRCKEENLLVGTMIQKNKLITDQALQVLSKGRIETDQTYSASGITARQSQSKPLGKA
jgi:flagellar biosynthesis/type III secretory pathway chaperone